MLQIRLNKVLLAFFAMMLVSVSLLAQTYSTQSSATFPAPLASTRVVVADFDNDGDADILYQTGANGTAFQFARSNGNGMFTIQVQSSSPFAGLTLPDHNGYNYHVADFDKDGDLDLWAAVNASTGSYFRNDNGTFSSQSSATFPAPAAAGRAVMGDFDKDGDADILYQTGGNGTAFQFARSNGNGTFIIQTQALSPFAGVTLIDNIAGNYHIADFDGDNDVDVWASVNNATGNYYRNDNGTFTTQSSASFPAPLAALRATEGDFDTDGDADILYQTGGNGTAFQYARSNGNGTFTIVAQNASPFAAVTLVDHNGHNYQIADFDKDGDQDVWGAVNNATGSFYSKDGGTPQLVSFTPANNSSGVSPTTNITYTFSESVTKGSGNIFITRVSDNTTVETIPVTSGQVTGSGTNWTIDPSVTLAPSTQYYVTSQSGTWKNVSNIVFQGVTLSTTQRFTTHTIVNSVSVPASKTYMTGENLDFTVNLSGSATVNTGGGIPTIPITIGSTVRNAAFFSGSGTNALVFRYTVVAGDFDSDGITVGSAIALNGGTIIDATAANVVLTLNNIGNTSGVLVNVIPQPGAALNFDGVEDRVVVPHNTAFNTTTLTAECWIKTSITQSPAGILQKFVSGSNGWAIYQTNANLTAIMLTPGASLIVNSSGQVINDGAWHHIAFVASPNGGGLIYIDGVVRGSATWSATPGAITNTDPLYIGYYSGAVGTAHFAGNIDEVRIHNRAICQAEIQSRMNCEIPTSANGLLANYHFNQGTAGGSNASETTLNDASGNGHNGTLANFALTGTTSNWVAPGAVTTGTSCSALPNVTINDISLAEGNAPGTTNFNFTVQLSAPAPVGGVKVTFQTSNGTATAGTDYTATSGEVNIAQGNSTGTITVAVSGDNDVEPNETFFVDLLTACNANITDAQGQGTIENDDATGLPTLSINDVTQNEGNAGTTTFTFTVSLSSPAPTGGVTFDIATADNTATTANNDYVAKSLAGQTIPAGSSTYMFDVTVNGDVTVEPNESFFVNVTNVTNATVGDGQGVGTITNDDAAPLPTLSINDVTQNEGNAGTTTFTFTVSLSSPAPTGGVTFDIATADNTATTANNDYVAKSLTGQTIPAGSSTYMFDVTVNGDVTVEPNESFFVNVTNVTNATVNDGQGVGTITNDDGVVVVTTYYPRTSATDLSQVSNWTDDPTGVAGSSPGNFSSPNQLFNLNTNVANPVVNGSWGISGGSNLVLNNTNPLVFTTAANFSLGSGSSADFNDKPVTLKSAAAGTAFIGVVAGTLTNASNVTVERYITAGPDANHPDGNRAYRLLAPSVNTATTIRANWQENGNNAPALGTHITGSTTGANGFDATQTGQGSLFTLNQVTNNWEYITNTNVNTLDAKKGYLMYIRGDRTIDLNSTANPLPSNNTTLRATGTLLTGAQSFTGLVPQQAGDPNTGFNLVTNPYAAAINWNSVRTASSNLAQAYTLWDPNIGTQGAYVTVGNLGIPSNPQSNANLNIQSGQAFFVQASGLVAPVVNIMETHKSPMNNIDVFRVGTHTEMFTSSLFFTNGNGNRINADGVTSVFSNDYNTAVDGDDATQIANWDEDIAISRNGHSLSIETRPLIDVYDTIYFTMARLQQRTYEWQFNATHFNHSNLSASLRDNFTGAITPINLNGITVIPFTVTSNPASSAANRFRVVFGPNTALPVNMSNVRAYQKGKDIQVEWTAQTEVNLEKYEVEESTDARLFSKAATVQARGANNSSTTYDWLDVNVNNGSNYYRIKAISKTGEVQYSKTVRVNIGKTTNEITVYPNPVKGDGFTLSVNLPKGTYTVTLTNKLGQQVYQKQIVHSGGAATQTLQLSHHFAQGIYQLTVSDGENNYVQQLVKE